VPTTDMNEYRNDVREGAELPILPRAPILAIQANQTDSRCVTKS